MMFEAIAAFAISSTEPPKDREWNTRRSHSGPPDKVLCAARVPDRLERRLLDIQELRDDWDTYGSVRPAHAAISTAAHILTLIVAEVGIDDRRLSDLHVGPTSGGIHLEWDVGSRTLEGTILPSGTVDWTRVTGDEDEPGGDAATAAAVARELNWLLG